MESRDLVRKLSAILHADVHGYSRLMGRDEVGTLHALQASRAITDPLIAHHHGRIVVTAGDSILAEFASVVEALQCAVEIQRELRNRNTLVSPEQRMELRIGVNLGDVMVEGEQIYGDGVNIAARLESLAEPGGIFISGAVYDQIKNKLPLKYAYLGEQAIKNIAEPVRVYRVVAGESGHEPRGEDAARQTPRQTLFDEVRFAPRRVLLTPGTRAKVAVASVLVIVGAIAAVWHLVLPRANLQHPTPSPQAAPAVLPLPDKPSIVVLPFVNLSGDPTQDYFSDGLSEVLTSDLSKLPGLFVIARSSAFVYKGKTVRIQDAAREMGVRYVVKGSVLKSNDQIRITAQLIDATSGHHLWSERYDRPLKEIFALQDELVQKIVTTLNLQVAVWEHGALAHRATHNLEAYDYLLRGRVDLLRITKDANSRARLMFQKAIELDPQYAQAHAYLATTYYADWFFLWDRNPQIPKLALELASKAVALDDSLPIAHATLGRVYLQHKQYDEAIREAERAVSLDPNYAPGYAVLGDILYFAGQPEKTIEVAKKAMRLDPRHPAWYLNLLGAAYMLTRDYDQALVALKQSAGRNPSHPYVHLNLAVVYSELGRSEEARAEWAEAQRLNPGMSMETVRRMGFFKDPAVTERYITALREIAAK